MKFLNPDPSIMLALGQKMILNQTNLRSEPTKCSSFIFTAFYYAVNNKTSKFDHF